MSEKKSEGVNITINKKDFWKYLSFVLIGILLLIGIFSIFGNRVATGYVVLEKEDAENELSNFLSNLVSEGEIAIIDSEDLGGIYEFTVNYNGNIFPQFITKDGNYYIPEMIPIKDFQMPQMTEQPSQEVPQEKEYSEEELELLKEFNNCLAENGMVIYGAYWCGFCSQLVDLLGGYEAVESVYVECTEEEEICRNEEISGYPTIKINGEGYRGERTLESFSLATGCPVPFE